jgi:MoaA/NifB/PqqE/SkfB family radical SAM enzyme
MGKQKSLWPQCDRLSIEVTTHCNSSCSHCFVRARGPRRSSLDPDLVRKMVLEGYELGYRRLHLTGGEPLLWDCLTDILDHAFILGYEAAFLNTNGTLLTPSVSRRLSGYNGLSLSVSLQGPKRLHERFRGKGSYEQTQRGINNALKAGLPVHIFTTVGRSIISDLPRFAHQVFEDYPGIEQLTFIQLIRVPGDVFDLSKEVLNPNDFIRLIRMISLLTLCGLRVDLLNNPLAVVASKILKMPWVPLSPPLYRSGSIMITADLHITLAHSITGDFGIYSPGILEKIISSNEYCRAVEQNHLTCRSCFFYRFCSQEGMIRPSEWYRDMLTDIPYCQRVLSRASSHEGLFSKFQANIQSEVQYGPCNHVSFDQY